MGDTGGLMIFLVIYIGLMIVVIAGVWKVFTKAGEPGWACLVPIYNAIVLLRIVGKPWWWIFLLMIPLVGIIIAIMVMLDLAKNFGKGGGFAVGLILLGFIFFPILGFGDAEYQGNGSPGRKGKRRRDTDDEWEERGGGGRGRAPVDTGDFEEDRPRSSRRADVDDEREERVTSSKPAARGGSPGAGDSSVVQCPSCDKKLRVPAASLGKRVKCPGCGDAFVAG